MKLIMIYHKVIKKKLFLIIKDQKTFKHKLNKTV